MKTLNFILSLSLACPFLSPAQAIDSQTLAKYSYPIFAVTGKQQHTGTAFFYRSGDTSFLVSNYHAIKGMNPLKQAISFKSDTLYLKYPVKNSRDFKILAVDISSDSGGDRGVRISYRPGSHSCILFTTATYGRRGQSRRVYGI